MTQTIPVYKSRHFFFKGKEFLEDPLQFTVDKAQKLGNFYRLPFPFRTLYVTTNLEVIRYVLQTNPRNYVKSPGYRQLKQALGNGLLTNEGESWRRQRRMIQPAFYKTQLEELFKKMAKVAENYCLKLEDKSRKTEPLDIAKEMMSVTADIVMKTLFSTENPASQSQMYQSMNTAQEHIMYRTFHPFLIPFTYINGKRRRFLQALNLFDSNVFDWIEERRNSANPPVDLLTMLLQARDAETGEPMSDQQMRDEAITIYSAGHETSANGLSWTLYLLTQHPEIVEKIRAEARKVLGERTPTFEDLKVLQYTRQVLEEGLRLYPPAYAVGRETIGEDEILGQKIPKKAIVLLAIYALHRDPNYWDNPEAFDPSRFEPEKVKERPRLSYLPFGAGPRMCIGNHFAMMEMQLILVMLLRKFDFELVKDHPVKPNPLVTLKPKYGIKMWVKNC